MRFPCPNTTKSNFFLTTRSICILRYDITDIFEHTVYYVFFELLFGQQGQETTICCFADDHPLFGAGVCQSSWIDDAGEDIVIFSILSIFAHLLSRKQNKSYLHLFYRIFHLDLFGIYHIDHRGSDVWLHLF